MCIFLKQWVLTTHCFSQVTERVKSTSASAAECGGPRPSVPPHFYLFYEFLSSFLCPRSGDDWGGGPQRPEGSHKDNMAMSLGNNIAKESSKGGDESVVFSRQQDYLLYHGFVCGPMWYGSYISTPISLAFNKSARLWVKKNWNLTDVTQADQATNSIPTDDVNMAIQGNVAMKVITFEPM